VFAAVTPPKEGSFFGRCATNPAQLSLKQPTLADKAIDAVLKGIQVWDNTVYICRPGDGESQPACL
jgi:hypothetical protein